MYVWHEFESDCTRVWGSIIILKFSFYKCQIVGPLGPPPPYRASMYDMWGTRYNTWNFDGHVYNKGMFGLGD